MNPAARNRARIAGWVFLGTFACAFAGLALVGFVFGLRILRLFGPQSHPAFLVGVAFCIAACATVGFWWATRPRHDHRARATVMPASDGDWPY
jgi:uncharacterized membrane protein YqjE